MFERAGGRPVAMKLTLTPRNLGTTAGGNVVGEITGRDPSLPPVLLACHLDSWWLGTGAFDDGAGCAIAAAAALNASKAGQPLRTIRVLMEIGRAHSELQSLMRISYAVFCLKK